VFSLKVDGKERIPLGLKIDLQSGYGLEVLGVEAISFQNAGDRLSDSLSGIRAGIVRFSDPFENTGNGRLNVTTLRARQAKPPASAPLLKP
jgi:hypothetical protein